MLLSFCLQHWLPFGGCTPSRKSRVVRDFELERRVRFLLLKYWDQRPSHGMSLGTPTGCASSLLSVPVGFKGSQASSAPSLWPQRPRP